MEDMTHRDEYQDSKLRMEAEHQAIRLQFVEQNEADCVAHGVDMVHPDVVRVQALLRKWVEDPSVGPEIDVIIKGSSYLSSINWDDE